MLILLINNGLLLSIENHRDTLIRQTQTRPQGTLEFVMNRQMQTFSFSSPLNLFEEGKWLKKSDCLRVYKFCF